MMDQDDWNEHSRQAPTVASPTWARQLRLTVARHWQPERLPPPVVDVELEHLSGPERSAEVMRYTCDRVEYWISPGGVLREWLRFNLRAAVSIAVPVVLVAPLVTLALGQFQGWVDLLAKTTSNLILFPLSVLLVIGLVSGLFYIGRSIMMMRVRQQRRDPYQYQ